eukprot:13800276-Alexandrium_andersonii.AAC.1
MAGSRRGRSDQHSGAAELDSGRSARRPPPARRCGAALRGAAPSCPAAGREAKWSHAASHLPAALPGP